MGLSFSTFSAWLYSKKERRVLMIGLDAAGKTTILYKLQLGDVVKTVPTIGFNVETVQYGHINFTVWDVGGQDKIRKLWSHYFYDNDALIFVVDANDTGRLEQAANELHRTLGQDELRGTVVLVYANKQDLPNAISAEKICDALRLRSLNNKWYIQPCVATTGQGLYEGLDWLATAVDK